MSYVIYDTRTTKIVIHPVTRTEMYPSMRAAKSARTKMINSGHLTDNTVAGLGGLISSWFNVAELGFYRSNVEQMKTVKNLMTDERIEISVNTPACCDPSTERYWSM